VLLAPAYFAKAITLGGMQQAAEAFGNVQSALSFFVSAYRQIAEWRAVVERLDGFETSIANATALAASADTIQTRLDAGQSEIALKDLLVRLPGGQPLISASDLHIRPGERTLITGPSGAGKSTLFRAIAGIWPFGKGSVTVPADARVMVLPQRPYFPVGSLRAAIAYPAASDSYSSAALEEALALVGLPALREQLDEEGHWNRMLSLGEQERLGLLRALLERPDFLFLDEATVSLDEPSEAVLYRLLQERLPKTTIVSIGHRSTLAAFHQRGLALAKQGNEFALADASPAGATP